jgi:H+/Cl- antiporter ClcA
MGESTGADPEETGAVDPGALIRSREYIGLLVVAGIIGLVVSIVGWLFLEVVTGLQDWIYRELPRTLGFDVAPAWWAIPVLTLAGIPVAYAITRLPGHGGHRPAAGLGGSATEPTELPGVMLAAIAGIGLGVVLGPEAPLLALGSGLGMLTIRSIRRGVPNRVALVASAAGSFAALSTIFGNPIIGAVIIIEAAGLAGPTLPLVLLPGLLAAGIGSIVFLGLGALSGLSSAAYALGPLGLPASPGLTVPEFLWTIAFAVALAIIGRAIMEIAWDVEQVAMRRPFFGVPLAGLAVGVIAMAFAVATGEPPLPVVGSGQETMGPLVGSAATLSGSTLAILFLCKGLAWAVSLGAFRGGPIFPGMFVGLVGGLCVATVLGLPVTPAVAVGMAAMVVSILRLPLSAVILTMVVTQAGLESSPLIILAVVVAYIVTELLGARRGMPTSVATPASDGVPAPR